MAVAETTAQQQFALLRERFRVGLANRAAEISAAQAAAAMPELASALHRLAGAAAPYGFAEIGVIARRAEALVLRWAPVLNVAAAASQDTQVAGAELAAALAELLQAIDDA
jgi:HPt (histidine-containing phosphotransfer) domain-containing protein